MPGTRRAYLNDNIRTEHLKCSSCRTQVFLIKIEPDGARGETRIFGCPHCHALRALHVAPHDDARRDDERKLAVDRVIC